MRAFKVLTGLLENLLEENSPADIIVLNLAHFLDISGHGYRIQQNIVAIFADHLQDDYQVLKISNVIDRQVQLRVSEMTNTRLQSFTASRAPQQFSSHSQALIERTIRNRLKRTIVQLRGINLSLRNLQDILRGKHREIYRFSSINKLIHPAKLTLIIDPLRNHFVIYI